MALHGLPGLLSLSLTLRYHQPLLFTGNLFFITFIRGLVGLYSFPELIGTAILAGGGVLVIDVLTLSERIARWAALASTQAARRPRRWSPATGRPTWRRSRLFIESTTEAGKGSD